MRRFGVVLAVLAVSVPSHARADDLTVPSPPPATATAAPAPLTVPAANPNPAPPPPPEYGQRRAAPSPYAPEEIPAPPPPRTRFGFDATLFGPNSLIGAGFTFEPTPLLEPGVWIGYDSASATEVSFDAQARAKVTIVTVVARNRFWLFPRHSLIFDVNAGVSSYNVTASATGSTQGQIDYSRKGTPFLFAPAIGYGFRSTGVFRFTVVLGALVQGGSLAASKFSSQGVDATGLQHNLDNVSDDLTSVRPYLETTFGFLFLQWV